MVEAQQQEEARQRELAEASRQREINRREGKPLDTGADVFRAKLEDVSEPARKVQQMQSAKTFLFEDGFTWKGASHRKGDVGSFDGRTVEEMMASPEWPLPLRELKGGLEEAPSASLHVARRGEASSAGPPAMAGTPLGRPENDPDAEREKQDRERRQQEHDRRQQQEQQQRQREAEEEERTSKRAKK
jgi:hypothetical protein